MEAEVRLQSRMPQDKWWIFFKMVRQYTGRYGPIEDNLLLDWFIELTNAQGRVEATTT